MAVVAPLFSVQWAKTVGHEHVSSRGAPIPAALIAPSPAVQWPCVVISPSMSPLVTHKNYVASKKPGKSVVFYLGAGAGSFDVVGSEFVWPWDGSRHADFLALNGGPKVRPESFKSAVTTAKSLVQLSPEQRVLWFSKELGIPPPTKQQISAALVAPVEVDKVAEAVKDIGLGGLRSVEQHAQAGGADDCAMAVAGASDPPAVPPRVDEAGTGLEVPVAGAKRRAPASPAPPLKHTSIRSTAPLKSLDSGSLAAPVPTAASTTEPPTATLPASTRGSKSKSSAAASAKAAAAAAPPAAAAKASTVAPDAGEDVCEIVEAAATAQASKRSRGKPAPAAVSSAAAPLAGSKRVRGKAAAAVVIEISDDDEPAPPPAPGKRASKKR